MSAKLTYSSVGREVSIESDNKGNVKITLNGHFLSSFDVLTFYDFAHDAIEQTRHNKNSVLIEQNGLKRRKMQTAIGRAVIHHLVHHELL